MKNSNWLHFPENDCVTIDKFVDAIKHEYNILVLYHKPYKNPIIYHASRSIEFSNICPKHTILSGYSVNVSKSSAGEMFQIQIS